MSKWNLDLCCGIGFSIDGINAPTKDQAIRKARDLVIDHTTVITAIEVDGGELEFDEFECIYAKQHNGKWDIELSFGVAFSIDNIKGSTRDDAIKKAKDLVLNHTSFITDAYVTAGDLEFDQCTYIKMMNK